MTTFGLYAAIGDPPRGERLFGRFDVGPESIGGKLDPVHQSTCEVIEEG